MSDKACEGESNRRKPTRRPYDKPVVEFVELHGDQVLCASCKTYGGAPSLAGATCDASVCSCAGSS